MKGFIRSGDLDHLTHICLIMTEYLTNRQKAVKDARSKYCLKVIDSVVSPSSTNDIEKYEEFLNYFTKMLEYIRL